MTSLPGFPTTQAARVAWALGVLALLVSLWAQGRMWLVELGLRPVAAGGGEYLVALLLGLPTLVLALGLLGWSVGKRSRASRAAWSAFGVALIPAVGWLLLLLRG
ncbi:MAG: hypothetical protein V2J02_07240 [Pseudomonadales bacterium]|nr:hypothetical protein [Pseudomonadales bacterium]